MFVHLLHRLMHKPTRNMATSISSYGLEGSRRGQPLFILIRVVELFGQFFCPYYISTGSFDKKCSYWLQLDLASIDDFR